MSQGGVPEPLKLSSFDSDCDLAALGSLGTQVRAEWRADEHLWMREAARRWAHGCRIGDVLREYAARGDRISVEVAGRTFDGAIGAVGDDRLDVVTASTVVTIRTALTDSVGGLAAPLTIRRSWRSQAGGRRLPPALATFSARMREMEEAGRPARVGTYLAVGELTGPVVVGADHVTVHQEHAVIVPLAWVAYVATAPEGVS